MNHTLTIMLLSLMILSSCENEFQPYTYADPVPVVYGLVSPEDSIFSILLMKSFVGPGSAFDMAQVPDSLFYRNVDATLELRHLNGVCVLRKKLEWTTGPVQQEGIFGRNPNRVLTILRTELPLDFMMYYSTAGYLCLNIHIWDTGQDVLSITPLIPNPLVLNPLNSKGYPIALYAETPFEVEWQRDSVYYEARVIFHYNLMRETDIWENKSEEFLFRFKPEAPEEHETLRITLMGDPFYSKLANKIRDYRPDDIRKFISLDFTVQAADPSLYQYLETLTSDLDIDLGTYTNIENGLGIFALTRHTVLLNYTLDYKSMDSLMGGRWTKHLNFRNW